MKRILTAMLLAMLVLSACGSNDSGNEGSKDSGKDSSEVSKEVTFASGTEPVGLSPTETWDSHSELALLQMYDKLFERDIDTGEIVPRLAVSYETPDDLTWIIELRDDVVFHDDTPFNAEAVKYTFEKLIDPETAAPGAHIMGFLDEVEVIDDHTVKLTTHEPSPNVLPVLANAAAAIISPTADQAQNLMLEPVGTGPFKFEEWVQGDRLTMVRNEDYWGEPAATEKITFIIVPEVSTALSMLETGEVDFIDGVEPEHLDRLAGMKDVEVIQREGTAGAYFSFNLAKEPMNELDFRKAVAMGINRAEYLTQIEGIGVESSTMFGPSVLDYVEELEGFDYEYNPEEAKKIIEENNYGDEKLTLYTTDNPQIYKRMAEITQAQLTELGLDIDINIIEWGTFLEATTNGDHDLYVLSSSNSMTGLETLYGYYHTESIGGNNRTQVSDEEFDEIVSKARVTIDEAERQPLINEAHQMLVEKAYMVPMHHGVNSLAHREDLKGLQVSQKGLFELKEVYRE